MTDKVYSLAMLTSKQRVMLKAFDPPGISGATFIMPRSFREKRTLQTLENKGFVRKLENSDAYAITQAGRKCLGYKVD